MTTVLKTRKKKNATLEHMKSLGSKEERIAQLRKEIGKEAQLRRQKARQEQVEAERKLEETAVAEKNNNLNLTVIEDEIPEETAGPSSSEEMMDTQQQQPTQPFETNDEDEGESETDEETEEIQEAEIRNKLELRKQKTIANKRNNITKKLEILTNNLTRELDSIYKVSLEHLEQILPNGPQLYPELEAGNPTLFKKTKEALNELYSVTPFILPSFIVYGKIDPEMDFRSPNCIAKFESTFKTLAAKEKEHMAKFINCFNALFTGYHNKQVELAMRLVKKRMIEE